MPPGYPAESARTARNVPSQVSHKQRKNAQKQTAFFLCFLWPCLLRFSGGGSAALGLLGGCLQVAIIAGPARAAPATRPNVLFIAVSDLRCDLGSYGVKHVRSPNLDRLAASGVTFTRAYCQQAVCNASRASVLTGLRPDTTRVWDLVTNLRTALPDVVTLPQYLRRQGYRAVAHGKIFHNTFPDTQSWDEPTRDAQGIIRYSEANLRRLADYKEQMTAAGKSAAAIARMRGPAAEMQLQPDHLTYDGKQTGEALEKMGELAVGPVPFFLAIGYIRPHLPFIVPKKYWDLYDRAKLPLATNPFLPRDAPAVAFGDRSLGGFYELRDHFDYADAPSPFESPLSEEQQRELRHGYYAGVSFIDAQVGRLLEGLEALGLARNTIVVLWSDQGWKLGEHNGWGKQTNYEIDTRVPLIVRAPGAAANGQTCRALVELVDLYPTLCELAGVPVPAALDGRSFAALLGDPARTVKDAAFSQFPRRHEGRDYMGYALRTERHRYVEWVDKQTGETTHRELYDETRDPDENVNIAGQPEQSAVIRGLSERLWRGFTRPVAARNAP